MGESKLRGTKEVKRIETVIDIAEEIDVDGEMMKGIEGPSQYDEEGMRGECMLPDVEETMTNQNDDGGWAIWNSV